jgi:hypothetical protein
MRLLLSQLYHYEDLICYILAGVVFIWSVCGLGCSHYYLCNLVIDETCSA